MVGRKRARLWAGGLLAAVLWSGAALWVLAPLPVRAEPVDYRGLYRKSAPGVVLVYGTDGKVTSTGSGSIIHASGLVLTNTHVVSYQGHPWPQLFVYLKPSRVTGNYATDLTQRYGAKVIAQNPTYDLALVQIENAPATLPVLGLGDSTVVEVGEPTVAIGHPGGGAPWSLTTGQISAQWQPYGGVPGWNVFQTNTDLNPGNSGGPLLDGGGNLIGINTFIVRKTKEGLALTGLNFAVTSDTAYRWVASLGNDALQGRKIALVSPSVATAAVAAAPPAPPPAATAKPPEVVETAPTKTAPAGPPRYTTKAKPGEVIGGDAKLDAFFKRVDARFKELDEEMNNLK